MLVLVVLFCVVFVITTALTEKWEEIISNECKCNGYGILLGFISPR